ncbi:transcription termination factor 3, mitochondrial [Phlebotomus argentipes]|uniref:transcription termination factor 3, mitochondrial n=1 Tax=Phlebotomus argentipes TaxID=94469 RepID=UPI002892B7B1|nr:transcription termination factor 3, mitochondrial [Phlebotomus argentipes]
MVRVFCGNSLVNSVKMRIILTTWALTRPTGVYCRRLCTEIALPRAQNDDSPLSVPENYSEIERAPNLPPTFNFASYINKSPTLQQLLNLGVDLYSIEKRKGLPQFVLKLDFERDMKHVIQFLTDQGVPPDRLGHIITKNPLIFKEHCDDMAVRINYLESKRFSREQISWIVNKNPFWLMFSTQRIDRRLGYFQKTFELSGQEVRQMTCLCPRLVTYSMEHVRKSTFSIKEEMGFEKGEVKALLLKLPKIWMMSHDSLMDRFQYVHKSMEITHEHLCRDPYILLSRQYRIRQRHEFLKYLKRAQYDPQKDLYVSLKNLVVGNDEEFVLNIARSTISTYNAFLKTL